MEATRIKHKILLIDDEPAVTKVIGSRLKHADYVVETAHSGDEGLKKLRSFKPDLVILDVILNDLTGYEVCAEIKGNEETARLPVIMLTSRVKTIDEHMGYACKADAYIRKPHSGELLLPTVQRLLEKPSPAAEPTGEKP